MSNREQRINYLKEHGFHPAIDHDGAIDYDLWFEKAQADSVDKDEDNITWYDLHQAYMLALTKAIIK